MSQVSKNQDKKIKRVICIGLGGTGRDILMRMRRIIIEQYGKLSNLPVVSFVHIDTDKGATQVSGLRTGNTYHGEDILFRDSEKIAATMNRTEVNSFVQGIEKRAQHERQSPLEHIARWFPPQLLKDIKAIEEGAKGIRPIGRLGFFHNFRNIKDAIDKAEKRTRGHETILLKKGLIIEPGLNIFVVGSLCGGTGSGMFLDVAYSLRGTYQDNNSQLFGYFIVSPELYGNTPIMNANTYAALKELNHYTNTGIKFTACYDQQHLTFVNEERPPFDYIYLVSNSTSEDYKILEKSKLCNVIAHKIALEFGGEISPLLKEQRDNFLLHMLQLDEHPRPNTQRYLTFGLAQMYFPQDITVQISLNRINLKLLNFWLDGEGQSPDVQVLLEQFLLKWPSDANRRDYFLLKLEDNTQEGNKTFSQTLNAWRKHLDEKITECKTQEERQYFLAQLPREFREQFRKVQPGETETSRGIWLTNLQNTAVKLTETIRRDIDNYLAELLSPSNPNFSLNSARAWLDAMVTTLNKYQRKLEDKIQQLQAMHRTEVIDKQWKESEDLIKEIEGKKRLFSFNQQRNIKVQEEVKNTITKNYDLTKHNFEFALHQEALEIVKFLQQHVQKLAASAGSFYNLLINIRSFYEQREKELTQIQDQEMSGEAIFADADTDQCYDVLLPNKERRSLFVSVSKKINERLGLEGSLLNFIKPERLDEDQLKTAINLTIEKQFGSRSSSLVQSVIKRFMEKYGITERTTRLEQILDEGEPLLPLNTSDHYFYNDPGKRLKILAFKQTDESEVKQFKTILSRDLNVPDNQIKPTQAEDRIIIITEYAGFPLRLISGLQQMKQQYLRQQSQEYSFLHNDYMTVFSDIIPPEARKVQQLQDIFYPCLAFDIISYNRETKIFEFSFYDALRNEYDISHLSPVWNEALEQLSNRQDITKELSQALDNKVINEIKNNLSLWESNYLPKLRNFVKQVDELPPDNPNYPYKGTVVGIRGTINQEAKEGIIQRFQRQIEKEIMNNVPTTPATKQLPPMEVIDIEPKDLPTNKDTLSNSSDQTYERLRELIEDKKNGYLSEEEFQLAKGIIFRNVGM
jgi:hypothetical protein